VVIATANHFLADAAAGLAVTALGLLAARATTRPDATGPGPGAAAALCSTPRQTHAQHVPGQLPAVLPTARHGCGPAPLPARHERHSATVIARRRKRRKEHVAAGTLPWLARR